MTNSTGGKSLVTAGARETLVCCDGAIHFNAERIHTQPFIDHKYDLSTGVVVVDEKHHIAKGCFTFKTDEDFNSDWWKKAPDAPPPTGKPRRSKQYRRMIKQRRKQGRTKK